MKKTTLLLAAAWMLLLWFVPESAWADPEPKTVSIYQSGFKRGTKLLYPLTPTTVGGITYTPVDLGTGIAWADRNIGANTTEDVGTLFYWGDTEGHTTFSSSQYYSGYTSMAAHSYLPPEADAAHVILGENWRMPSMGEWAKFYNYNVPENSNSGTATDYGMTSSKDENIVTVSSTYDPAQQIQFPVAKYNYLNESSYNSTNYPLLWTRQQGNAQGSNSPVIGIWSNSFGCVTYSSNKNYYGLPVRPVYVPTCETCTLNIGIQVSGRYCILYGNDGTCWEDQAGTITYWFRFICEKGQQVTVNPIGNTGYVFYQWKASNNSTVVNVPGNVFTVTENATYYATFREQYWNTTWNNYDGTQLTITETRDGAIPVYSGATPTKPAPNGVDWVYVHSGWTPTPIAATGDATYTATFSQGYTLSTETGGKGTVTLTASGYPDRIGSGDYATGTSVTMTATPNDGAGFVRWSDNGSTNPVRTVEVNGNVTYTAVFGLESPDASVDVYENASVDKTKILHSLNPTTVGEITYNPIDLGYGVAWADKNVGAATENAAGNYFIWGETTPITQYRVYGNIANVNVGYILSETEDAATVNIGDTWRMPTNSEWQALLDNTNVSGTTTFINKTDENLSITLPLSGVYMGYNSVSNNNTQGYYWGSELMNKQTKSYWDAYFSIYEDSGASLFTTDGGNGAYCINTGSLSLYMATPIRAIYQPKYNVKTLTIIVNGHNYVYKCQEGQSVTVTANATTEGHVFDKWTEDNDTHATRTFVMTDNITRTATFKEAPSVSTYTIHFLAGEGSGTMSDQEINVGEPTNLNANTFTAPTATITYDYQGATGGNSKETDVVTAEFDSWYDEDSETSYNDEDEVNDLAAADETVTLTAQWMYNTITLPTPTKTGYTFAGWEDEDGGSHDGDEMFFPEKSQTLTATWTKANTLDLYDNQDATYYNNIKALGNTSLSESERTYSTVIYHRSVAYTSDNGNARWYTLCLPFDVDQSQLDINGLTGKVYEYRYAEGSADENDHVTFHFRAVKSPNYMHAGQGYLVKATGNMGPDFTFTGVTLDTDKDTETNVNALKTNSANAYKESGDIAIVGVLRNGTLHAVGKQVMGLANNKIWYPHSSGNPMPAYRAYFYNPSASASVMPRVRIVVEGEGETELEVVDGELYDARGNNASGDVRAPRKYIRNGVLIIECNGVTYDAQGKRL